MRIDRSTPTTPGARHEPVAAPAPRPTTSARMLAGVIDPELQPASSTSAWSTTSSVEPDGAGRRSRSRSPPPGCPLRAQIQQRRRVQGARPAAASPASSRVRRDDRRAEDRRHAAGPLERPRAGRRPPRCRHHPGPRRRERQGRRGQVVGHREPRRRARGAGLHGRRARRRHLGLQRPAHARRRGPPRRAPTARSTRERTIATNSTRRAAGRLEVVSMGFLVDDEGTALMWRGLMLTGPSSTSSTTSLGRPRLPAHRHATGHRRRADGPGPHAPADRDDHRHHAGASPPRRSPPASPTWRAASYLNRRRRREHERVRRAHGQRTRCSARAAAPRSPRRSACRSWPRSRSSRRCRRRRRRPPGRWATPSPAAAAFRDLAARIVDELLPPVEMAGCTARDPRARRNATRPRTRPARASTPPSRWCRRPCRRP